MGGRFCARGRAVVALLFTAFALPASAHAAGAAGARITAERALPDHGVELTIATTALAAPTKVEVYLPDGYDADPGRRWPVVYYLHGAQGDQARFHPWYGALIKGAPAIFVAPAGGHFGFYSDWFNGGAFGPPKYETYDIDQLLPLIDARFRTTGTRAGRALIGESMGGFGVTTYGARHPDLFTHVTTMSGFNDSNVLFAAAVVSVLPMAEGATLDAVFGPRATQEIRWHGHNPTDLADNLRDVDLQVLTGPGTPWLAGEANDGNLAFNCVVEQGIYRTTNSFHSRLVALGIPHLWKAYPSGCHTIPSFQREFADALPGVLRSLAHPRPYPKRFTYRSIEPRFTIWGWTVSADPARALEMLKLRDAGRGGATLTGSGTTTLTTPPFFAGADTVDVISSGRTTTVAPDATGRIRFRVDLGPAHEDQQSTPASRAAGEGEGSYFRTRTVTFAAH